MIKNGDGVSMKYHLKIPGYAYPILRYNSGMNQIPVSKQFNFHVKNGLGLWLIRSVRSDAIDDMYLHFKADRRLSYKIRDFFIYSSFIDGDDLDFNVKRFSVGVNRFEDIVSFFDSGNLVSISLDISGAMLSFFKRLAVDFNTSIDLLMFLCMQESMILHRRRVPNEFLQSCHSDLYVGSFKRLDPVYVIFQGGYDLRLSGYKSSISGVIDTHLLKYLSLSPIIG